MICVCATRCVVLLRLGHYHYSCFFLLHFGWCYLTMNLGLEIIHTHIYIFCVVWSGMSYVRHVRANACTRIMNVAHLLRSGKKIYCTNHHSVCSALVVHVFCCCRSIALLLLMMFMLSHSYLFIIHTCFLFFFLSSQIVREKKSE